MRKSFVFGLVPFVFLISCGQSKSYQANEIGEQDALQSGSEPQAKPGAPKAADVDVPDWAVDHDGCEKRGLLDSGGRDEVAGIYIGMPINEVRDLLKCFETDLRRAEAGSGGSYSHYLFARSSAVDTWRMEATRKSPFGVEEANISFAGPKESARVLAISYNVHRRGKAGEFPSYEQLVDRFERQYGDLGGKIDYLRENQDKFLSSGVNFFTKQSQAGEWLVLNSPAYMKCNRSLDDICGRGLEGGISPLADGSVKSYGLTLENGVLANSIVSEAAQ